MTVRADDKTVTASTTRQSLKGLNLALRGVMEAAIVFGLGYWGWKTGTGAWSRIALAILAPTVGFGIWGLIDFRSAGVLAEPLRLIEELVISAIAALGLYVAGQPALGWGLAALSVAHHGLVYLLGERLIKERT